MKNWFPNFAVATASLTLSLVVSQVNSAQAATVIYSLTGQLDSGSLTGETYSGTFSFDDATLTGSGSEFLAVSELEFEFLATTFTEADAASPSEAEFSDGVFLGLLFAVDAFDPQFTLFPGSDDATDAAFAYVGTTASGFGNLEYTVVPEPLTLLGAGTALGFGAFFKRQLAKIGKK